MNKQTLKELYLKYELTKDDVYKHQHYVIITRSGIEKIQAIANIQVQFEAKVLVIEKDRLGGTCVNRGCVPKKVM